jgi:hypothetical protein
MIVRSKQAISAAFYHNLFWESGTPQRYFIWNIEEKKLFLIICVSYPFYVLFMIWILPKGIGSDIRWAVGDDTLPSLSSNTHRVPTCKRITGIELISS